jgi:DnaB-like helicase N terminal domain
MSNNKTLLPQHKAIAQEAEKISRHYFEIVLGATMLEQGIVDQVHLVLDESLVSDTFLKRVCRAIVKLHSESKPTDIMCVFGAMERIEGENAAFRLAKMLHRINSGQNIRYWFAFAYEFFACAKMLNILGPYQAVGDVADMIEALCQAVRGGEDRIDVFDKCLYHIRHSYAGLKFGQEADELYTFHTQKINHLHELQWHLKTY